jgi:hypothetical protein
MNTLNTDLMSAKFAYGEENSMDCIEPSVLLKFKSIKSYHKVNN